MKKSKLVFKDIVDGIVQHWILYMWIATAIYFGLWLLKPPFEFTWVQLLGLVIIFRIGVYNLVIPSWITRNKITEDKSKEFANWLGAENWKLYNVIPNEGKYIWSSPNHDNGFTHKTTEELYELFKKIK